MWRISLVFIVVTSSHAALEDFAMPRYSSPLSKAVIDVIENFYVYDSSTVNIIYDSSEEQVKVLDIINEVLYHVEGETTVQVDSLENPNAGLKNGKKFHNIVFLDSMESFERIFNALSSDHFDYEGIYLFVLTKQAGNVYELMARIFERLWSRFITNANVLWQPMDDGVEALMYTYYPYTTIYCGKAFPVKLNQYVNDEWLNDAEYFPRKMENLYRCPLRVAVFSNPPFMMIRHVGDNQIAVDGIDGILLRVLSQKMNFNVELFVPKDQWGNIYSNGSSTGAVGMVVRKEVNLTIGYFASTLTRRLHMSSSYVYFTSNLIWMVPPGQEISSLEKLLKPFDFIVWICVLLILLGAFLFVGALKFCPRRIQDFIFGSNIRDPVLNIVSVMFVGSVNKLPPRNFARSVLMTFMIYCFVITNSYKGGLLNFMQITVREREVATTDEMIAKDFKFYMFESSKAYLTGLPAVEQRSVFTSVPEFNRMLDRVMEPGFKGAVLTSRDHLAYRNIQAFPNRYYSHAPEEIFANNLVIYLNKNSCLKFRVDQHITNLISAGMIDNWASIFIDKNFLKHQKSERAKALKLSQLLGAFQLLLCGLFIGLTIFFVEVLHTRLKA